MMSSNGHHGEPPRAVVIGIFFSLFLPLMTASRPATGEQIRKTNNQGNGYTQPAIAARLPNDGNDITFRQIISGKMKKKGALSVDFEDYKAQDGTRLSFRIESYRSPLEADNAMQVLIKQAARIVDRSPRLNNDGSPIGERAVFILSTRPNAVAAWTSGADLDVIESPKLDYVLAFEKLNFQSGHKGKN